MNKADYEIGRVQTNQCRRKINEFTRVFPDEQVIQHVADNWGWPQTDRGKRDCHERAQKDEPDMGA
jgi:hypothetical protein